MYIGLEDWLKRKIGPAGTGRVSGYDLSTWVKLAIVNRPSALPDLVISNKDATNLCTQGEDAVGLVDSDVFLQLRNKWENVRIEKLLVDWTEDVGVLGGNGFLGDQPPVNFPLRREVRNDIGSEG